MLLAIDVVVSFIFFLETVLQALDTFYIPSGAGKMIANLTGICFVLAYSFLLYASIEVGREDHGERNVGELQIAHRTSSINEAPV